MERSTSGRGIGSLPPPPLSAGVLIVGRLRSGVGEMTDDIDMCSRGYEEKHGGVGHETVQGHDHRHRFLW
jgi:hypothetical protein